MKIKNIGHLLTALLAVATLMSCRTTDPRNTCGPKVPFEECIK